ncbi:MAG TPA: hypothetical protein PLK35_00850 [Candidatus Moranbacteria bacterium]|nr:hypothetical protein [Candidatus Moranbacteria bacterium]
MEIKANKFVYWTPRVLSIILIAFMALMSLDIFDLGLGFWGTLGGLFMHNIPALILLAVLIISWKREMVGGIVFTLAGILYIFLVSKNAPDWKIALLWSLQLSGIAFIIGGFFIVNAIKKK